MTNDTSLERLGTDSLGRAIHACADCGSREGAPYTQHLDDKVRCHECAPKHDVAEGKRQAEDRRAAKSAEAHGLPTTYKAAVEEVHEWREASQVDGYFTPASLRQYLVNQGRHHDEHHAREKRIWDAIGGEPEDDADPEVVELDDAVRVTLQYERDQAEQARSVIDAAKAGLPEYLLAEPDLIFAVKVLAGHYAGAQKTNADFGAHIGELERACRAFLAGHTASEIAEELKKESNGSPFALAVRALHWKALDATPRCAHCGHPEVDHTEADGGESRCPHCDCPEYEAS